MIRPGTIFLFFLIPLWGCTASRQIANIEGQKLLGFIADCQYADAPTAGVRHYRSSPEKLRVCVEAFNTLPLSHIFHLGDFIDKGGTRSLEAVLPILETAKAPHTLVLGNHDFEFPDEQKMDVPARLGLKQRYFSLTMEDWRFIVLDGNDVSLYAWPENSPEHRAAKQLYESRYAGKPTYNGALGTDQLNWLRAELEQAQAKSEKVVLLCHFPVLPVDNHVLWNSEEVVSLISRYDCVKAWLNGHNHAGDYVRHEGIHFLTFKGMVDTEENAYATVRFQQDRILVEGRGREPDRTLVLK